MTHDYLEYEALRRRVEERYRRRRRLTLNLMTFVFIGFLTVLTSEAPTSEDLAFWAMVMLLWALPLAFQGLRVYLDADRLRAAREERVQSEMEKRFGAGWQAMASVLDYDRVRQAVEARSVKRWSLALHIGVFAFVNGLLWAYTWVQQNGSIHSVSLVSLAGIAVLWGVWLGGRTWRSLRGDHYRLTRRERAIEREIERELAQLSGEKAKRKQKPKRSLDEEYTLAADGELVPVSELAAHWQAADAESYR